MSASRPQTVRLSHALADALALRAKELGYKSMTALVESLARYDVLCRSKHGVTKGWADDLTAEEQDLLDAKLFTRAKEGKGMTAAQAAKVDWRTL